MYNGSNHFGKAYQDEMRRVAGVFDEQEIEIRRQTRSQEPGLLRRLFGRIGQRKQAKPALTVSLHEPQPKFRHIPH
jgi:hypothetical protein